VLIQNIYRMIWLTQKYITRIIHRKPISQKTLSSRKSEIPDASVIKVTLDELPFNSYKINYKSNFRKIISLSNVKLNPKTGVVWSKNKIISESSLWDTKDLLKWEPKPFLYFRINGIFNSLPDNGFFHFLIEDLPRFIEVNSINKMSQSIGGSNAKYIIETLDFLSYGNYFIPDYPLKLETLYLSEKIHGKLFSNTDLDLLKSTFASQINEITSEKIFISRQDKKGTKFESRGILKKSELENLFTGYGFQIVFMEELSFFDQIKLSSSSICIAGFHGAGLSNIIWAKPGTKIIEITNSRDTEHFQHISKICEQKYFRYSTKQPLQNLIAFLEGI